MMVLTHRLERAIVINAPRDLVFRFFTDSARWAAWWGAGSTIDARPGGRLTIRHPNGVEAAGEVLEIAQPDRIAFTFGYASGAPMPPGASRVTITLEPASGATRVRLQHEFADAAARDQHVQGWRFQLSLFANVVANERHAGASSLADAWFKAWDETDPDARQQALARIASPAVRLHDKFSCIEGIDELSAHIAGAQRFMPGVTMTRTGEGRQCQGTMLVDWSASRADGQPVGSGTNVFVLGLDGRIESVTGFWS
jgi:uncharacterized protein YndB with AHSA1/START domain